MTENWETNWEDYYQILGIPQTSDDESIKKVYLYKVQILHTDRMKMMPDSVKQQAEKELAKVNYAYGVLKVPLKRREYDKEWLRRKAENESSEVQGKRNLSDIDKESSPQPQPKSVYNQRSKSSGKNKYRIILLGSACLIVILLLTWRFAFASTNKTPTLTINNLSSTTNTKNATITYELQTSVYPVGAGTITPSNGTYANGTSLSLLATANFPYAFTNWIETDNNNFNPTMVTINSDKSVTANFKKLNPGTIQNVSDQITGPCTMATCQLNAGQWIQGEISASPDIDFRIVDGNNNTVQDIGRTSGGQFTFQAQTNGLYSLEIYGTHSLLFTRYTLSYYIYS
jgi:hypothetical protein